MLKQLRALAKQHAFEVEIAGQKGILLYASFSDGKQRAHAYHFFGPDFAAAWAEVEDSLASWAQKHGAQPVWIRIDWGRVVRAASLAQINTWLQDVKRNYMRWGLILGSRQQYAFTEQELNANAMLYRGVRIPHAQINENNFLVYGRKKYPDFDFDFNPQQTVYMVDTAGAFISADEGPYLLYRRGRNAGRRVVKYLDEENVTHLITTASEYLISQVKDSGRFIYGWHPCFGREIRFYNTLRHASTVYSMVEAWEVTRSPQLKAAIDKALQYLLSTYVKYAETPDGQKKAYLVEEGFQEIKLGANGVLLLALTKYTQVFDDKSYLPVAEALALGIQVMQDPETGGFVHILNYPDLTLKERFRVVYYDGEAAFGLMRLYGITRDARWLAIVEKAFGYFIANDYWKNHDHWLSYCVNELTTYKEKEEYYRFGIQNVAGYLDFVADRITTFPTLLELIMAAEQMVERLQLSAQYGFLLDELDLRKFYAALEKRAMYLLNGYFAPEIAMYFADPQRILGSFFIRHHSFRVRIDDVEHYLSGYVAYLRYLKKKEKSPLLDPGKTVGMLSYPRNPTSFFEANEIAARAQEKGLNVFYFSYTDFDVGKNEQYGYLFKNGFWVQWFDVLPQVIDNAPPRNRAERSIDRFLRSRSRVTFSFLGGKRRFFEILGNETSVQPFLIEQVAASKPRLKTLLRDWKKLVLKPYSSNRGRSIFILKYVDGKSCLLKSDKEEIQLTVDQAWDRMGANENWMIQKYVPSVTSDGKPFDIRVPVFRGHQARWQQADMYARVGQSHVTSNLATGGSALDGRSFLKQLLGEPTSDQVYTEIKKATQKIVDVLQAHYDFEIDAFGCDFGLDGAKPYLFEVNSYPGLKGCYKTAVPIKVDFYKYLLDA